MFINHRTATIEHRDTPSGPMTDFRDGNGRLVWSMDAVLDATQAEQAMHMANEAYRQGKLAGESSVRTAIRHELGIFD